MRVGKKAGWKIGDFDENSRGKGRENWGKGMKKGRRGITEKNIDFSRGVSVNSVLL